MQEAFGLSQLGTYCLGDDAGNLENKFSALSPRREL